MFTCDTNPALARNTRFRAIVIPVNIKPSRKLAKAVLYLGIDVDQQCHPFPRSRPAALYVEHEPAGGWPIKILHHFHPLFE
jgi:hypothetical protein